MPLEQYKSAINQVKQMQEELRESLKLKGIDPNAPSHEIDTDSKEKGVGRELLPSGSLLEEEREFRSLWEKLSTQRSKLEDHFANYVDTPTRKKMHDPAKVGTALIKHPIEASKKIIDYKQRARENKAAFKEIYSDCCKLANELKDKLERNSIRKTKPRSIAISLSRSTGALFRSSLNLVQHKGSFRLEKKPHSSGPELESELNPDNKPKRPR